MLEDPLTITNILGVLHVLDRRSQLVTKPQPVVHQCLHEITVARATCG